MKRALIAASVLSLAFAMPAFAVESGQPAKEVKDAKGAKAEQKTPGDSLAQRKAGLLKRLDERIASMQQERKCIKAAKTQEEFGNCRESRGDRGERRGRREGMKKRGGQAGQAGQTPAAPAQGQ